MNGEVEATVPRPWSLYNLLSNLQWRDDGEEEKEEKGEEREKHGNVIIITAYNHVNYTTTPWEEEPVQGGQKTKTNHPVLSKMKFVNQSDPSCSRDRHQQTASMFSHRSVTSVG